MTEVNEIMKRYERRQAGALYSPLQPWTHYARQERIWAMIRFLKRHHGLNVSDLSVLEVGCGTGGNLLILIQLGFSPANLHGNELLEERADRARKRLPDSVEVLHGDASTLEYGNRKFDLVIQSTVFTSILDPALRTRLAQRMWDLVKPGGAVLWYDFAYNNPRNKDVEGISRAKVQSLFPAGSVSVQKITLAPPIARFVSKIHPAMYTVCNTLPILRSHLLIWLQKETTDG